MKDGINATRRELLGQLSLGVGATVLGASALLVNGCGTPAEADESSASGGGSASSSGSAGGAAAECPPAAEPTVCEEPTISSATQELYKEMNAITSDQALLNGQYEKMSNLMQDGDFAFAIENISVPTEAEFFNSSKGGKWSKHNANVVPDLGSDKITLIVGHNMNYDEDGHRIQAVIVKPLVLGKAIDAVDFSSVVEAGDQLSQTFNFHAETTLADLGVSSSDVVWGFLTGVCCNSDGGKISAPRFYYPGVAKILAMT